MIRHWKLTAAIAAVLIAAGLGIGLAIGHGGPSSSTTAAIAATASPFTKAQQSRLERGITAPTVTAQANVVAAEVRSQFKTRGKPLLPPGAHVSINDATFHALSAQLATVDATVSGPRASHWQFVLVRESSQWLLLGTRKLS